MHTLARHLAGAPFIWVVGKGGVGKTTTAAAIALHLAHRSRVHLISTDPAHSIGDVLQQPVSGDVVPSDCAANLTLEAFDATRRAHEWLAHASGPVASIIEAGTYLDAEDVAAFSRLALPGVDEMMAVLRLVDLAGDGAVVVVDTAPTGHALRLLDVGDVHAGFARALRAMADKAAAVAGSLAGRAVRVKGEEVIEEMEHAVRAWEQRVLARSCFVVATSRGSVVAAETARLTHALHGRNLDLRAVVLSELDPPGSAPPLPASPVNADHPAAIWGAPYQPTAAGCAGLSHWMEQLRPLDARPAPPHEPDSAHAPSSAAPGGHAARTSGVEPLSHAAGLELVLFAGKGGVGKSTCAAAWAVHAAAHRDVLLCSTDPAGSLTELFPDADDLPLRLRIEQVDAGEVFSTLRQHWKDDVDAALGRMGLAAHATLDRRVLDALWDLTPPGLDELAATAAILAAAAPGEQIVLDTAPTGHFLRMLAAPALALAWTRQCMRLVVKYGIAGGGTSLPDALLRLSRELRSLQERMQDPARSGVVVVTGTEPVVFAETRRLINALAGDHVPVIAVILNRLDPAAPSLQALEQLDDVPALIGAPRLAGPPAGQGALRAFANQWQPCAT